MKFVWPILESILSTQLCSFITFKITILYQNLFLIAMVLVLEQKTLSHNQTMGMDYYLQCYDGLHIFSILKIMIHSQYTKRWQDTHSICGTFPVYKRSRDIQSFYKRSIFFQYKAYCKMFSLYKRYNILRIKRPQVIIRGTIKKKPS